MAAWRCTQCSLINRETDQACRRCGLQQGAEGSAINPASAPANYGTSPANYGTSPANYGTSAANYGNSPSNYGTPPVNEPARVPSYGVPANRQPAQQMPNVWGGPESVQAARFQTSTVPVAGVWRDGSLLVMQKGATLPRRCLKCNAPGNGQWVTRTLRPAESKMIFLRFIPYVRWIYWIWRAASQSVEVSFELCHDHYSRVNVLTTAGNLMRLAGLVLLLYGLYAESLIWIPGLFMGVIGTGISTLPIVKAKRLDDYYVWMSGVDPGYLASLPPVNG